MPFYPSSTSETYIPDQLIAGTFDLVTDTVTIASGAAVLARGTVLGVITASGKYTIALSASSDGSQTPVAILADQADPTGGDVTAPIYRTGEFNSNSLTLGTGITLAAATAALRANSIFIKTGLPSDPV